MRSLAGREFRVVAVCAALLGCGSETPARHGDPRAFPRLSADAASDTGFEATSGGAGPSDAGPAYDHSILSFVAAHVYQDLPSLDVKSDSKFEVFLLPTIHPSEVASIRVLGPDGFEFDIMNVPFLTSVNGYIQNDREPTLWYQAIFTSTLADGRYTARVTFVNGERQEYSRVLASDNALLEFYLAHKDEMQFHPSGGTSPAGDTVLSWSTLRDLGGPDAYYNAWISSDTAESITANNLRGDSIFLSAFTDPTAGLNAGSSRLGTADDPLPLGPATWQPEVMDSNALDGINQIIFPPGQHFVAE